MCLLAAPTIPLVSQSQARIDSLQGRTALHNMLLLWDLDTFCLLLSGSGDPLPSTSTPLRLSFFPPPSPLLPPLFPGLRQRTCDDRGVSTGHSDPLLPFCSHWPRESMHSSPFSLSINLLSVLSGSTFLPIKSLHCPAWQGSGYAEL